MNKKHIFFLMVLCVIVFSLSGCSLLQAPLTLVGGTFKLLGKLLNLAGSLPKPPPWIFI
ncbi:hypothetical protein MNBD_BACTEROID05-379 [hydrothermal vent metagenome]|uniref:Lipoprotein n=1 Tax=hydrothermal vent metagenome TaxID=652676 RepID=A0A3B0TFA7_9ZZZZ